MFIYEKREVFRYRDRGRRRVEGGMAYGKNKKHFKR